MFNVKNLFSVRAPFINVASSMWDDNKEWMEGYEACELDHPIADNPYTPTSGQWDSWEQGWMSAFRINNVWEAYAN